MDAKGVPSKQHVGVRYRKIGKNHPAAHLGRNTYIVTVDGVHNFFYNSSEARSFFRHAIKSHRLRGTL